MSIYISGSLAFDNIMQFPGSFADAILPEKLHILNISFLINKLEHKHGGTAGNIAYSLALLGEKPTIFSSVGQDFDKYKRSLLSMDLPLDGISVIENEDTAACYIITDRENNQISGFYPAAMSYPCRSSFRGGKEGDWGIVSPGNLDDMRSFPRRFRESGIPYIYDPGQQIPALSGGELLDAITGADVVVTNDYELEMICRSTGRTRAELCEMTGYLITTLGEQGATLNNGADGVVSAVRPTRVKDPTGAGDAYRAGLIKGIIMGFDMAKAARMGSTCASFCVEQSGTQEHAFSSRAFVERHLAAFNERILL